MVIDADGKPLDPNSDYHPNEVIHYFREIEYEPEIPFKEEIIYQDENILVACKPHFLPVTPAGEYVNECLLHRLRQRTGNDDLVPLHRIDRETAGLVLFSMNRNTRDIYHALFRESVIKKTYMARALVTKLPEPDEWAVENRIETGTPWFRMQIAPGPPNSCSQIQLISLENNIGEFLLIPQSGKKHQLRLHMNALGYPILNDNFYPALQPPGPDDFDKPLQLLAKSLSFKDPISGKDLEFRSLRELVIR